MRPELEAIARRQHGLVTRQQAVSCGYRTPELRTLTATGGQWCAVRRGVYTTREIWKSAADTHEGLARLRDRAADLTMRVPHVMSHDSAGRAWGLPLLRHQLELVHITRDGVLGTRTEHGVKHHRTKLELLNTRVIDGMHVTGLARTAVDVAREHGATSGVVAIDGALRIGSTVADLNAEVENMKCWPGVTQVRAAIELSDPGAETPGESLTRLLAMEAGLGPLRTQFPIQLSRRVGWVDLIVGCHVIEFDGRVKYFGAARGGVADRQVEDVVWAERERQREIEQLGFGVSRVIWDELFGSRRKQTLARLAAEFEATRERRGAVLPAAFEEFADRVADERTKRIYRGARAENRGVSPYSSSMDTALHADLG